MIIEIQLNGTDTNPWHQFGLNQNPFPQIASYKYSSQILHLQKLGGDPIPNTDYIRNHLKGWSKEFVDLCCKNFVKGQLITFKVKF